jgi:RNA polymerase sigma-70 factor, ECF subfamily
MANPAAAVLFERHHLVVFRFLLRMTGSVTVAEDLTQEVFLRVVRSLPGYEEQSRERAWVFRIARNVLVDRHREAERAPAVVPLDAGLVVPLRAPQELTASLYSALSRLPAAEREAFLMRELGGLGYEEIAAAAGATPASVRMQIYRARLALRAALRAAGRPRPAKEMS